MSADQVDQIGIDVNAVWESAKGIFFSTLSSQSGERGQAERYFDMIMSINLVDNTFVVSVSSEMAAELLQSKYASKLKSSLVLAGVPDNITISFKADEKRAPAIILPTPKSPISEETSGQTPTNSKPFVSTMPLKADYTFTEFVQGPSNSFALSAAKAVAKNPGKQSLYNPLFIYGGTGLGKTHLMQAIGNFLLEKNPKLSVCYLTAETFLNEYVNYLKNGNANEFRDRYRSVDLLLIDDVQFLNKGMTNFQEEFFNTFNFLQQNERQIVMTSDVAPNKMHMIEERLISRFQGGMVQEIESPSYETRFAILKKKMEAMTIKLDDRVIQFIAENVTTHVRAMEGALTKVGMVKEADPTNALTSEILSYILKDVIEKDKTIRNLSIENIQKAVASKYGVTINDFKSTDKSSAIVTPRQLAMFISKKITSKTLKEIGSAFDRNHATIIHAVKSITQRLSVDDELKNSLEEILTTLGYKLNDVIEG